MKAREVAAFVQAAVHSRIQDVPDKRRLAAAADSGDDSQHTERELDVDILEVMLHSSLHRDGIMPRAFLPYQTRATAREILESERTLIVLFREF